MKNILCLLNIHKYKYSTEHKDIFFKRGDNIVHKDSIIITVKKCSYCDDKKYTYSALNRWKKYNFKKPIKEERKEKLKNILKIEKL